MVAIPRETGGHRTGTHRPDLLAKSGGDRARCSRDARPGPVTRRGSRVRTLTAYAVGGGRPRSSGTADSGVRNSAAIS